MKYRGKKKMQYAGTKKPDPMVDQDIDLLFSRENRKAPNMRAIPMTDQYAPSMEQMKQSLPDQITSNPSISPYQGPIETDWANLLRQGSYFAESGLASIGNRMEQRRQDEYMQKQLAMMGRPEYAPVEDYQPNPYSMYAKYGGKIKKYQTGGRLVQQVPAGYNKVKTEGNREFYEMQQQVNGAQLQRPTGPVTPTNNPTGYRQNIIQGITEGKYTPEEAADAGLISRDRVQEFMPYVKKDLVYTETQPQAVQQPYQNQSFDGAPAFFPQNHPLQAGQTRGRYRYVTSQTDDITNQGGANTAMKDVEYLPTDRDGNPLPGAKPMRIPGTKWSYISAGTSSAYPDRLDEYLSSISSENTTKLRAGGRVDDYTRYAIYRKVLPQLFKAGSMKRTAMWRGKAGGIKK